MTEPDYTQFRRTCDLTAKFGPEFQAEFDSMWQQLQANISSGRQADDIRNQIHVVGAGAVTAALGPFGALIALFGQGLHEQADMLSAENRAEAVRLFNERVMQLCEEYQQRDRDEADFLRYSFMAEQWKAQGGIPPSYESWQKMTEPEKLQWLPIEAEPLESLRARVAKREAELQQVQAAAVPQPGWLVTTTGRIRRGPWVRL